jgi:hypothetical protein
MNKTKVIQAAARISENETILKWLEGNREGILSDLRSSLITVKVSVAFGDSTRTEAGDMIANYLRLHLPEAILASIANCRNTIGIDKATIRAELDITPEEPEV